MWRIRRKERSPEIEVFRIEEAGHGEIVSDEFINWRIKLAMDDPLPPASVPEPEPELELAAVTGGYVLGL